MTRLESLRRKILPLREQLRVRNQWLQERLDTVIPHLMGREQIDLWLIICREYNEDPIVMTMLPAPAMSARRTTILAFCRNADGSVDRLTIDRYGHGSYFLKAWDPDREDQWDCLARIIQERNPQQIAVNTSAYFAFGDGITHTHYQKLSETLGDEWMSRVVSGERLSIGWLETRILPEIVAYPALIEIGHALIEEAFSNHVIHPGITTTNDVAWWMRQTMHEMGLEAWFQPDCQIQAPGQSSSFLGEPQRNLIMPGDLLWCDVGFYYLGLATDQQELAYVLRPDEQDAPEGLKAALADGNQLQDILMQEMLIGRTGNEVLQAALSRAKDADITGMIYTHPLGNHGHAAGPTIGLWDQQNGVPGNGDYPLFQDTAYSIELNIRKKVPEWDNQEIHIMLEQDAILTGGSMRWLDNRQTSFHLIG